MVKKKTPPTRVDGAFKGSSYAGNMRLTADRYTALPLTMGKASEDRFSEGEVRWRLGDAMKARKLIDGASFDSEVVKAMGQAFDQAWNDIAANFGTDPKRVE